jgi:hypothetical protein
MKHKWIVDEIYHRNFYLCWNSTEEYFMKWVNKREGTNLECGNADASTVIVDDGKINSNYIWIEKFKYNTILVPLLSHEVMHYVHNMLSLCGMKLNDDTEEAYAFYFQYIFWKILKLITSD